jgi:hypothetical protein
VDEAARVARVVDHEGAQAPAPGVVAAHQIEHHDAPVGEAEDVISARVGHAEEAAIRRGEEVAHTPPMIVGLPRRGVR